MYDSLDAHIFKQATKNDSRVTPIGKYLRKYSIDELPQLINVFQGNMSVIGPRPHPIALDDEHQQLIKRYNLRFKVKPGITGWAQVNGYRGETDTLNKMEGRIKYDLEYITNWSLFFDLKIILLTIVFVIKTVNAY
jgi:putative colanic acid biosynthesis UDP-glucose lipid carrier transferase